MAANRKDLPQHYYSLDEYFALERAGDARYEYWDGDIYCMSGGSRAHGIISSNVFLALAMRRRGGPCRTFTPDTAILTPTLPPYRDPGASVACGELRFKNVKRVDALINPVLVVEVLSPGTAERDYEAKFIAYQQIESFREYLLIAQEEPRVTHYARQPAGPWLRRDESSLDASLSLDSLGIVLTSRDIYEDVDFSPLAATPETASQT